MRALILLSAAVVVGGCTHRGQPAAGTGGRQAAGDEAALAAVLQGRVAGPPQDCVNLTDLGDSTPYGRDAILFRGHTDEVVYVNRPAGGCPALAFGAALRSRTSAAQLCRGDIVTVFDSQSGTEFGGCALGQFTPWRRPR